MVYYGESNGHVTDDCHVTMKGQTRDLNTLRAKYLVNSWKCCLATTIRDLRSFVIRFDFESYVRFDSY